MKVSDVMSRQVEYVGVNTTVKDVCRIIFGGGINGVPVCEGKKIVGFITERDILEQLLPSMQEYVEDYAHARDFEGMEEKASEILALPVDAIMSKDPRTISPDMPLLRAQSLMFIEKVGRLPVVDDKGNLVGILSKGDIFAGIVGEKIPHAQDEEYHDWLARRYDVMVQWDTRLSYEVPNLISLFRKEHVKKVIDIGAGTGEHVLALAKEGFEVVGLERSNLMHKASLEKWEKLSEKIKQKVTFIRGDYIEILNQRHNEFDAAIFMGNALSHNADNFEKVLDAVSTSLPSHGIILLQIINFEKVFTVKKRFLDFNIGKSTLEKEKEYAFVEFYDPPRKAGGLLTLNMAFFNFNGRRWSSRGMNSTPIANITKEKIGPLLKKVGFSRISFYGSSFWGPLFKYPFKRLESDWLNVIAKR